MNVSTLSGLLAQVPPIDVPEGVFSSTLRPDEPVTPQQLLAAGPELSLVYGFLGTMTGRDRGFKNLHQLLAASATPSKNLFLDEVLALYPLPKLTRRALPSWRAMANRNYAVWQVWQWVELYHRYYPEHFETHPDPLTGNDCMTFMRDLGLQFANEGWFRGESLDMVLHEAQMNAMGFDGHLNYVSEDPGEWKTPQQIIQFLYEQGPLDMGWFVQTCGLDFDMGWESLYLIEQLALTVLLSDDPETGTAALLGIYDGEVITFYHNVTATLYGDEAPLSFSQFSDTTVRRNLAQAPPLFKDGFLGALSLWVGETGNLFIDVSAHQSLDRGYTYSGWEWCIADVDYLQTEWRAAQESVLGPVERLEDWIKEHPDGTNGGLKELLDWCFGLKT